MAKNTKKVRMGIRERKRFRIRKKIKGSDQRPRLTVFRSAKHLYCQAITDESHVTLLSASTLEKDVQGKVQAISADGLPNDSRSMKSSAAAKALGAVVAERLKEKGITDVVFDRNGYRYHGRVKALADGIREGGLEF